MMNGADRFDRWSSLPATRKRLLAVLGISLIASDLLGPNPFINTDYLSLEIEVALGLTAIILAMSDRAGKRRSRLGHAMIVMLLSIAVAGISAEAATRWVFRNVTSSADGGGYFSRQSRRDVMMNEYGFREHSFTLEKPAGEYRIAVVGDSFTFGSGLQTTQRYTDLMEQWLPEQFEVLNFGIPGSNTPQHLETLRVRVLPAHPDFVLLQWFVNDIEGNDVSRRPHTWPLLPIPALHRWLNANSALYTIANMRFAEAQIMLGVAPSYPEYLKARAADADSPDARRDAALLHEIVEVSHRAGSEIAIVLFPDPGQDLGSGYPFAFLHERVMAVCRQEAIPCIDLRNDLATVKDRRSLWVSPFDHHPSERANVIAALKIVERLQNRWVK
jgi:hypothetical protein